MNMPGFSAEVSSYKSSVHYRSMAGLVQADGAIFQQLPFAGITRCGPCYTDDTGACVRDCLNPNGEDVTVSCRVRSVHLSHYCYLFQKVRWKHCSLHAFSPVLIALKSKRYYFLLQLRAGL